MYKKDNSEEYTGDKLQNQFTAYVNKALKNNRINYHNKQISKQKDLILYASEEEIPIHIQKEEPNNTDTLSEFRNRKLLSALNHLSENDLTIIRLRAINGYSYKEISTLLGISVDTANVRYFRAITKLRKIMEDDK